MSKKIFYPLAGMAIAGIEEFAKVGFRPVNSTVAAKYASKFPKVPKLYTISAFGGWSAVQDKFFKDGGIFDQVFKSK